MKKRLFNLVLTSAMTLPLVGCGGSQGAVTAARTKAETEQATTDTSAKVESTVAEAGARTEGETALETAEGSGGGALMVGLDQGFPPIGSTENGGEYAGFDLEPTQEMAKRLGLEYGAQPIAWDSEDMELEVGNIDCIWNGFIMTGREDNYTWSESYMVNTRVFMMTKDFGMASQEDLTGRVVECQVGSSVETVLKKVPSLTTAFRKLPIMVGYSLVFMDLEQGTVDVIAMDVIMAGYQIQRGSTDFVILGDSLSAKEYGAGFKKGNTQPRGRIQATLEEMAVGGTLKSISEK